MTELVATGEHHLGVLALQQEFQRGTYSPRDAVDDALRRIDEIDERLSAFCFVDADAARRQADDSCERWGRGQPLSSLDGVPIALKDNIPTVGMPSYWGAAGTSSQPPAVESCVVSRLREAGAVILGKTTMAELGFYASGVSSRYGDGRNPWDPERTAGGSSGGAAAAVASGMCAAAIGSDAAGSIRMPASFCGVVGVKPTGGRVPVLPPRGLNPVSGPIARNVADAAAVLQVIAQPDERDHNAVPFAPPDFMAPTTGAVAGMRIGYLPQIGYGEAPDPAIARAVQTVADGLARAGAYVEECPPLFDGDLFDEIVDADLPHLALLTHRLLRGVTDGLLPSTREALAYAKTITLDAHLRAVHRATRAAEELAIAARPFDVLVTPTVTRTAFEAGIPFPPGLELNRFGYAFDFAAFVHIANIAAVPACTVPCGRDRNGLPIGMQIIGKRFGEDKVVRAAAGCERVVSSLPVPTPELRRVKTAS
jgi:aspartyl-tRNA(Asn)/glutamyl-tRNA(Gln) amidotransferase subunit A